MSLGVRSWPSRLLLLVVLRFFVTSYPPFTCAPAEDSNPWGSLTGVNTKIGDVDISYDRQREGEQVLLVMGLGTPRVGWFHQFYALSQGYDVCSFDNRGVGETVHPGGSWTMADMVADAIGLADAIGFERFHLVGISMGGMISQEIALAHPDRLRSLTLMA